MEPRTHLRADPRFCGHAVELRAGFARVALDTTDSMVVDARGLVHGGFVFALADYAAMLAVNDPNVVLGAAEARFLKPVRGGDRLLATAQTLAVHEQKHDVRVEASVNSEKVFEGMFTCFVPERHVLEEARSTG